MDDLVQRALHELKQKLQELYGPRLHGLYLYGSQARGIAHEGSDIDVMMVLKGAVKAGREITRVNLAVSEICLRYDLLISVFPVPVEWLRTRQSPFFETVRKEALAL